MSEIKGVDISRYQRGINYYQLKADGVKFAIVRAGYAQTQDIELETHIKNLKAVGIPFGLYWYMYAGTVAEAKKEAECCLSVIDRLNLKADLAYPVFADIEEKSQLGISRRVITDIAITFCETLAAAGVFPGIYANPNFMESAYYKEYLIGKYDIWLAHWTNSPLVKSKYQYGQTMWQWGIAGCGTMDVDADICFIDYPDKIAKWRASLSATNQGTPSNNQSVIGSTIYLKNAKLYSDCGLSKEVNTISGAYSIVSHCQSYGIASRAFKNLIGYISIDEPISNKSKATTPSYEGIVNAILAGYYSSGDTRKHLLEQDGFDYTTVQNAVNERVYGPSTPTPSKSIDEIASAVLQGSYGNGEERKSRLEAEGYDYNAVQSAVNKLLEQSRK